MIFDLLREKFIVNCTLFRILTLTESQRLSLTFLYIQTSSFDLDCRVFFPTKNFNRDRFFSACGFCCHRKCSVGTLPKCDAQQMSKDRRPSFLSSKFAYLYCLGYEHSKSSHNPDRRTLLYVLLFA